MVKRFLMVLSALLVVLACTQQPPKVERLHVEGTALMNESGDTVELKGMSFGWNVLWPRFYNASA
ncbi:MAG: glycoside hydrolase family 5 protein, partial [Bacteroidales bacterium]|nr:glycoside hydrolase family 5 protein [Bacteroidales bacterium]